MSQPNWKFIANLGDRNPIEYGGYFVFDDTTRVYSPEAELLIEPQGDIDSDKARWTIYRFILEPCTHINGILSDNKFHPDKRAWFANDIGSVSNFVGISLAELVDMLCNGNSENKAIAWRAIGDYFGFENLDSYPLSLTLAEVKTRYAEIL
jgi:hypothetical protein